ncbi:hypothetical protein Vretimale_8035 [Volvox reticuliferus]|uniref:SHSP domain-containing protein n=1 Tax=Volvox reticuliferus TaxID=1737510 RepID=A0A8J4C634_9CHLO|nr:hypothetical protein Vretifemale_5207 [Volvox reticuliferus]GIM03271.1 hypothetical protein Vretimale_8035 [Volvox reticuliferus]
MHFASVSHRFLSLAKHGPGAMFCAISNRLPFAASTARYPTAAPFQPPARSFLTRAQKESSQPQDAGAQQSKPEGGSQLQSRPSQGELSMMPFGAMMPVPFRRMADHMLQMQREMDSLMGAFGMPSSLMTDPWDIFDRAAAPLAARRGVGLGRMIPLDVSEDDKCYTVTAEVPGFDKSEIKVSLSEDGVLTMTGAHQEGSLAGAEVGKEGEAATKAEGEAGQPRVVKGGSRRYESFVRSIQLPDDADMGAITANTQHGVLAVRIPKTARPAPKVREIPLA